MNRYLILCIFGDGSNDYSFEISLSGAGKRKLQYEKIGCESKIFKLEEVN